MKAAQFHFVFLLILFLASCADPNAQRREYLLTEMKLLENKYSLIGRELQSKKNVRAQLEQQLSRQQVELSEYNQRVEMFILNHKLAVAALAAGAGGAAIAYDPNNEFSEDVRNTAKLVGVVAVLYALGNMEEVSDVADQLMQASRRVDNMKSQIKSTKAQINRTYKPISDLQAQLNSIQAKYNKYRKELEGLRR